MMKVQFSLQDKIFKKIKRTLWKNIHKLALYKMKGQL